MVMVLQVLLVAVVVATTEVLPETHIMAQVVQVAQDILVV
jgi:hypothetical protein